MLEILSSIGYYVAWTLAIILFLDLVVIRTLPLMWGWWYYGSQGIPFIKPVYPLVGCSLRIMKMLKDDKVDQGLMPFFPLIQEQLGDSPPPFVGFGMLFAPVLIINRPEPLTEVFLTKNK